MPIMLGVKTPPMHALAQSTLIDLIGKTQMHKDAPEVVVRAISGLLDDGFFDAIVSIDAWEYFGTDDHLLPTLLRVLRPGGFMIHAFPGKYAPFALINQLLPNRVARRLVGYLHPEWREEDNYGFLAFYDHCCFSAVRDLLDCNGFKNVRLDLLYYQSVYFNFCFPLYIMMLAYDLIASVLGIRNLASGIVVTAERSPR